MLPDARTWQKSATSIPFPIKDCFASPMTLYFQFANSQSIHTERSVVLSLAAWMSLTYFTKKDTFLWFFLGGGGCKSAFSKAPKREKSVINSILRSHIDIVSHLSVSLWRARPAGAGSHALSFLPGVCASCAQRWLVSGHGADSCLLFIIYLF